MAGPGWGQSLLVTPQVRFLNAGPQIEDRNLLIERRKARKKLTAIGADVDPVMLEVFNNLFMSIAEQMGVGAGEHGGFGQH